MASQVDPARLDVGKTRRRVEDALRKQITPEQLIEIARELGVDPALTPLPEVPYSYRCDGLRDPSRPDFGPDQVRCMSQLIPGLLYQEVHDGRNGFRSSFRVKGLPYFERSASLAGWWVEVEQVKWHRKDAMSLLDHNLLPYEGGHWNPSNWIAFTDESRPVYPDRHN